MKEGVGRESGDLEKGETWRMWESDDGDAGSR
jgi:hypothetical protein